MKKIENWSKLNNYEWKHDFKNVYVALGSFSDGTYYVFRATEYKTTRLTERMSRTKAINFAKRYMRERPDGYYVKN